MIIADLPTEPAPPKMSIHWSTSWAAGRFIKSQEIRAGRKIQPDEPWVIDENFLCFGLEPNMTGARRIRFEGKEIRVFPHEFSAMTPQKMERFITEEEAYDLVPGDAASDTLVKGILDGETRPIYEAALIDGCNHNQAIMTALGMDLTIEEPTFPAVGYYVMKEEYARYFG